MRGYGYGYSHIFMKNGGLSPEALAWEARIIANGGIIPAATLAIFDEYFFIPAKANGSILSELDRLNIYCGLNGYEIAARTNTIKSAHYVTPVSSPTFDNNGYKSSGTSYLNLNYTPSTQAVKLTLDSVHHGCVVKTPPFASVQRSMGCANASTSRLEVIRDSNSVSTFCNSNGSSNTNKTSVGNVFCAGKRPSSSLQYAIINSSEVSSSQTSVSLPPQSAYELTVNGNGTPDGNYDTSYHLASWHGSANLDYTAMRTILNNLFTALGL